VPAGDFRKALADTIAQWNAPPDWQGEEAPILLALARIWYSASTGAIASKDAAAAWAGQRMPPEHAALVQRAARAYLGTMQTMGWRPCPMQWRPPSIGAKRASRSCCRRRHSAPPPAANACRRCLPPRTVLHAPTESPQPPWMTLWKTAMDTAQSQGWRGLQRGACDFINAACRACSMRAHRPQPAWMTLWTSTGHARQIQHWRGLQRGACEFISLAQPPAPLPVRSEPALPLAMPHAPAQHNESTAAVDDPVEKACACCAKPMLARLATQCLRIDQWPCSG